MVRKHHQTSTTDLFRVYVLLCVLIGSFHTTNWIPRNKHQLFQSYYAAQDALLIKQPSAEWICFFQKSMRKLDELSGMECSPKWWSWPIDSMCSPECTIPARSLWSSAKDRTENDDMLQEPKGQRFMSKMQKN